MIQRTASTISGRCPHRVGWPHPGAAAARAEASPTARSAAARSCQPRISLVLPGSSAMYLEEVRDLVETDSVGVQALPALPCSG